MLQSMGLGYQELDKTLQLNNKMRELESLESIQTLRFNDTCKSFKVHLLYQKIHATQN